jgi:hypothetical protein
MTLPSISTRYAKADRISGQATHGTKKSSDRLPRDDRWPLGGNARVAPCLIPE